ncbi:pupal cuticle protein 36 [Hyalella azteca]|uniref:Pupal cuticle protein 36 n=1 Tax=Hyalella azteca TaxID=294128 RepID=A0A979FHU8_HYAAZ|nr:pupal cuticle protein 36 [Hyalella azteca]
MAFYIFTIASLAAVVSAGYHSSAKKTFGSPVKSDFGGSIKSPGFGVPTSFGFSSGGLGGIASKSLDGFADYDGFEDGSVLSSGGFESGFQSGFESGIGGAHNFGPCPKGLERTIHGQCVPPAVSQDLFLFKAPSYRVHHQKAHFEHKPKVHLNLVFIRAPTYEGEKTNPIIVPPPRQQTLVYLLSKKPHGFKQDVIEVPFDPTKPEVFFVDYKDGDNPVLPGGIDLRTALTQSAGPSDIVIGGDGGFGGLGGKVGGFGAGGEIHGQSLAGVSLGGGALGGGFGGGISKGAGLSAGGLGVGVVGKGAGLSAGGLGVGVVGKGAGLSAGGFGGGFSGGVGKCRIVCRRLWWRIFRWGWQRCRIVCRRLWWRICRRGGPRCRIVRRWFWSWCW